MQRRRAPLPRTQLAVADAKPASLGVLPRRARRSAPRAAGDAQRMAFARIPGVEFRSLRTFGHRNFVHCIEILMTQRRLTNFAMPDARRSLARSLATTKPWQLQQ